MVAWFKLFYAYFSKWGAKLQNNHEIQVVAPKAYVPGTSYT